MLAMRLPPPQALHGLFLQRKYLLFPRQKFNLKYDFQNSCGPLEVINPLSPNSDQHQFSPNNIHTMSRD